jgi:hypothetical protein
VYPLYEKAKSPALWIFNKLRTTDIIFLIPFIYLSLKVRLDYHNFLAWDNSFPTSDDSKWYLEYAYSLLASKGMSMHMNDIMYMGYNLLLTFLLGIFKNTQTVLFIQAVVAGLSVIFVFKIARKLFNLTTALIASYFYCYYTWGVTLWSSYILSDSFFISLLLLNIYLLLKAMETKKKLPIVLFVLTSLYLLVFRPTGVFSTVFVLLYILINTNRKVIFGFLKKYRLAIGGSLLTAFAAVIYLLASGKLDPFIASIQYNAKLVLYNVYARGKVYDVVSMADHPFKPDYRINIMNSLIVSFIVNNWDNISVLYGRRIVSFIGRWVWSMDLTNRAGIVAFAYNVFPTVLFVIGTIAAVINGVFRKASIVWLMVLTVFIFCIVLFIDGMYRYRAPSVPFMIIIMAYGVDSAVRTGLQLTWASIQLAAAWGKKKPAPYSPGLKEQNLS